MAISHAQPLFLLFVSLFFLPAALGTVVDFNKTMDSDLMNVTKVEIIPYPITYHDKSPVFKITGVTSRNLTDTTFSVTYQNFGGSASEYLLYNICDLTKCPMEPGPFVLTVPNDNHAWSPTALRRPAPGEDRHFGTYRMQFSVSHPGDGEVLWRREWGKPPLVDRLLPWIPAPSEFGSDEVARFLFHASALPKFTNNDLRLIMSPGPGYNGGLKSLAEFTNNNEITTGGLITRVNLITDRANVARVEILPFNVTVKDNPVFRIIADTPKSISSNLTVIARMVLEGEKEYSAREYKLCDTSYHCPITPGRFVLALASPYSYMMKAGGTYSVDVQIREPIHPFKTSMSVNFKFSVSAA